MNAGGKDHSRPTNRPTLSVIGIAPFGGPHLRGEAGLATTAGWARERTENAEVAEVRGGRGAKSKRSVVPSDVVLDHLVPVGPIVRPAVPDAQRVPDVFGPQLAGEPLVAG